MTAEKSETMESANLSAFDAPDVQSSWAGPDTQRKESLFHRAIDSFKRNPGRILPAKDPLAVDGRVFDAEAAAQATADTPLSRQLKGRHLQMIAIGGSIGMSPNGVASYQVGRSG